MNERLITAKKHRTAEKTPGVLSDGTITLVRKDGSGALTLGEFKPGSAGAQTPKETASPNQDSLSKMLGGILPLSLRTTKRTELSPADDTADTGYDKNLQTNPRRVREAREGTFAALTQYATERKSGTSIDTKSGD